MPPVRSYEPPTRLRRDPAADPLAKDPLALLEQHYRLTVAGNDTLLGRPAVVIAGGRPSDGQGRGEVLGRRRSSLPGRRRDTFDAQQNVYTGSATPR